MSLFDVLAGRQSFKSWLTGRSPKESDVYANYEKVEEVTDIIRKIATTKVDEAQDAVYEAMKKLNDINGVSKYVGAIDVSAYDSLFSSLSSTISDLANKIEKKAEDIKDYEEAPLIKKVVSTSLMRACKIGEGVASIFETIGDGVVSVIGWGAGLLGAKKFQQSCYNFAKKDLSRGLFSWYYDSKLATYSFFTEDSAIAGAYNLVGKAMGIFGSTISIPRLAASAIITKVATKNVGETESGTQVDNIFDEAFTKSNTEIDTVEAVPLTTAPTSPDTGSPTSPGTSSPTSPWTSAPYVPPYVPPETDAPTTPEYETYITEPETNAPPSVAPVTPIDPVDPTEPATTAPTSAPTTPTDPIPTVPDGPIPTVPDGPIPTVPPTVTPTAPPTAAPTSPAPSPAPQPVGPSEPTPTPYTPPQENPEVQQETTFTAEETDNLDLLDASDVDLDDATQSVSFFDEIVNESTVTKLPTASSAPRQAVKKKSSKAIPIAAGLTAVAAAGIGAKAYMDWKKNNSTEEEEDDDEFSSEDWSENDSYSDSTSTDYMNNEYNDGLVEESYNANSGYSARSNEELVEA